MKKLRGFLPTTTLILLMACGTALANGGLLISDVVSGGDTPTPTSSDCTDASNAGVIITNVIGVIITNATGVIITNGTGVIITNEAADGCPVGGSTTNGLLISD